MVVVVTVAKQVMVVMVAMVMVMVMVAMVMVMMFRIVLVVAKQVCSQCEFQNHIKVRHNIES